MYVLVSIRTHLTFREGKRVELREVDKL